MEPNMTSQKSNFYPILVCPNPLLQHPMIWNLCSIQINLLKKDLVSETAVKIWLLQDHLSKPSITKIQDQVLTKFQIQEVDVTILWKEKEHNTHLKILRAQAIMKLSPLWIKLVKISSLVIETIKAPNFHPAHKGSKKHVQTIQDLVITITQRLKWTLWVDIRFRNFKIRKLDHSEMLRGNHWMKKSKVNFFVI